MDRGARAPGRARTLLPPSLTRCGRLERSGLSFEANSNHFYLPLELSKELALIYFLAAQSRGDLKQPKATYNSVSTRGDPQQQTLRRKGRAPRRSEDFL